MAKRITQETFDSVVKENIEDFGLEQEEAVEDAIKQFESQGVDLSNIVCGASNPAQNELVEHLKALKLQVEAKLSAEEVDHRAVTDTAKKLTETLNKHGAPQRALAAGQGAFPALHKALEHAAAASDHDALVAVLESLTELLDGQPDLIIPPPAVASELVLPAAQDSAFITLLCNTLREQIDHGAIVAPGLRAVRKACIKHEQNRQTFIAAGIALLLTAATDKHGEQVDVSIAAAQVFRALALDDDLRVPFGKAHETARELVDEHNALERLTKALRAHQKDPKAAAEISKSIARLTVRDEYCLKLIALDGLKLVTSTLDMHSQIPDVVQACFTMLKAMSGNDEVKDRILQCGGIGIILHTMQEHIKSVAVADKGCAALAAVALRKPDNCQEIVAQGGPHILSKVAIVHNMEPNVLKQVFSAVRNCISRSPELHASFLNEGFENLANEALRCHKECHDSAKSVLRDLGCKVELKEEWKGKKVAMARD